MTGRQALFLATLGSALLMAGAYAFQHIGGMAPCKMCIWQRYPHVIAIAIGADRKSVVRERVYPCV